MMDKAVAATPVSASSGTTRRMRRWMRRGWHSLIQRQELVVFLLLLLFGVILSFGTTTFLTSTNLLNVALGFSLYAIAAFGATMIIIVGGIYLSVGSTMAL